MSRPGETKDTLFAVMEQIQQFKQELRTRQIRMPLEVAEFVFAHPVATPVQMGRETGIHYKTASRYLVQLAAEGLLE
ncbi:MAG: hypothetical protein H7Z21_10505, partial [Hymenobacter sp.]|nr:hypothetical protein [Hymenobacter sp.]